MIYGSKAVESIKSRDWGPRAAQNDAACSRKKTSKSVVGLRGKSSSRKGVRTVKDKASCGWQSRALEVDGDGWVCWWRLPATQNEALTIRKANSGLGQQ